MAAATNWNTGVSLDATSDNAGEVTAIDGDITVTGSHNGTVTEWSNQGVWVALPVVANGDGEISITGHGGAGTGWNRGIRINSARVETNTGEIRLTGRGGDGTDDQNEGVVVDHGVVTTNTGRIAIEGTSGPNNSHGVELWGTDAGGGGRIVVQGESPDSSISVRASGAGDGTKDDFAMYDNTFIGGPIFSGPIQFYTDTIELHSSSRIEGTGDLSIAPATVGLAEQSITLGTTDSNSRTDLNLTEQELNTLQAGFHSIQFGSSDVVENQNFVAIGNVSHDGNVRVIGGTIRSTANSALNTRHSRLSGRVEVGDPIGILNLTDATLEGGQELAIQIAGPTPGAGAGHHDQVIADGAFTMEPGSTLSVSLVPGWQPEGGEEIVIVRREGGFGEFDNLREGSILLDFFGASITYVGGDGDDIVLRIPETIPNNLPPRNWARLDEIGTAGTTVFGADAGGRLGQSVNAAGDVNGDGIDDFLIGANRANTSTNGRTDAGEAYLIYGSRSPDFTIDIGNLGDRGVVFHGAEALNVTAHFVDAGDFNGDGYHDVIIGAHEYAGKGGAFVVWGAPDLPQTIDLANLGTAGITITGADDGDLTGNPVASLGDINDDGFDDIGIGAIYADGTDNLSDDAGEATIIFGGDNLPTTIDLNQPQSDIVRMFGSDTGDEAGVSIFPLGDINGDDIDDFAVGARFADGSQNATSRAGEAYIFFGRESWNSSLDLATDANVTIFGSDVNDFSGWEIRGGGDVNGDGFNDLIVGVPLGDSSDNQRVDAGEARLIFGGSQLPSEVQLNNVDGSGVSFFGGANHDLAGRSVDIVGDLNGDGYDDIAMGAYLADGRPLDGSPGNAGTVYVVLGRSEFDNNIDLANLRDVDFTLYGTEVGDSAGIMVRGAGDVNNDGFADLIVGAREADSFNNALHDAGEAYVIYGDQLFQPAIPLVTGPTGPQDSAHVDITWTAAAGAESYELWLERIGGDDNPFVNPKEVLDTTYHVAHLPIGRYRAWVRANRSDGTKSAWRTNNFSISDDTRITSIVDSGDGRPQVSWMPVNGATGYRVYVSNLTQQQNALIDTVVSETSFIPPSDLELGRHRFWIQPIGPSGFHGSWSRHADFNAGPEPVSPTSTLSARPTFTWTEMAGVESVQIYIQTGPNVVVNESGVTGNSFTPDFDLDHGFYRWWVRATASNGRIAGWSTAGTMFIGSTQVTGPVSDVIDGFADITWQPLEGIDSYEVYLYSDSSREVVQRVTGVSETEFQTEPLRAGSYRVWIRPHHGDGTPALWSRPYSFVVAPPYSTIVAPLERLAPTFDTTPTFRWTNPAGVDSYNLYLTDGTSVIHETGLTSPEWTPAQELNQGVWKWRVQAVASNGDVGSWSVEGVTDTTARAVIIGPASPATGSSVQVNWIAVTGATRYVFQLDDIGAGVNAVIRNDDVQQTDFPLGEFSRPGRYRAWVRAVDGTTNTYAPWSFAWIFEIE